MPDLWSEYIGQQDCGVRENVPNVNLEIGQENEKMR